MNPLEVVPPGDRYARIVGMLLGNKLKVRWWVRGGAVYILDGKAYIVHGEGIDIHDAADYGRAVQDGDMIREIVI